MNPAPPVTRTVERLLMRIRLRCRLFVPWAPTDESGRNTSDDSEGGYISRHDRTGSDDGALADRDSRQDHRVDADVGPRTDSHRPNGQIGLNDRDIRGNPGVHRAEHLGAGSPAHIFLNHEIARVEVTLRADPYLVGDDPAAVETPLQHGLITNEHARSDFERLGMPAEHTASDLYAVAEAARERPPCRAAHHRVEFALTMCEAPVQLHQCPRLVARTHRV